MKLKLLLVATATFFCFLVVSNVQAQRYESAIEFSPGYAQEGFGFKVSYDYFHNRTDFLQGSFLASFSNDGIHNGMKVSYSDYLLSFAYFTPMYKTRDNSFMLFFGGGPSLGYESVNHGESNLLDGSMLTSKSSFLYGLYSGLNAEYYLSDSFSLFAAIDLYYHFGSQLGNVHFYSGVGIKYFLN